MSLSIWESDGNPSETESIGEGLGRMTVAVGGVGAFMLLSQHVLPYLTVSNGIPSFVSGGTLDAAHAPTLLVWAIALASLSVGMYYLTRTEKIWPVWGLTAGLVALLVFSRFGADAYVFPSVPLALLAAIAHTIEQR